ncbi:MAG: hypothetical protein VX681_06585 [Myxococcota bacterium]|nr:hypothetical protein [Myxococcota bacterium]
MRLRVLAVLLPALGSVLVGPPVEARDQGADGKFSKRTSSHFVLFQDVDIDESGGLRGSRQFEDRVLATLEEAYESLDSLLGMRPSRPITVTIRDPAVFDAEFAGLFRFPAAGFYGDSIHIRGTTVVGERLVRVLHHELVHAAFHAKAPSLVLPAWFNEGTAEWFEARATGQRGLSESRYAYLRKRARTGELFALAQMSQASFGGLGPNAAASAYLQSYAFMDYLARRYGDSRIRNLVRELLRTGNLDRSFRKTFRVPLPDLESRWKSQLAS